jgi:hypothetical protein
MGDSSEDHKIILDCLTDWLDANDYVYASYDLLLSQVRTWTMLTDSDRQHLTNNLLATCRLPRSCFPTQAWQFADVIEKYDTFSAIKSKLVAHVLSTSGHARTITTT